MKRTFQNTLPRSFSPVTLICPMVVGGLCNLIWKKLPQEFCLITSGWEPARISYICYILDSILLTSLVQAFDFSGTLCWSLTFVILCSGCLTLFPDPASDGSTAVPSLTLSSLSCFHRGGGPSGWAPLWPFSAHNIRTIFFHFQYFLPWAFKF